MPPLGTWVSLCLRLKRTKVKNDSIGDDWIEWIVKALGPIDGDTILLLALVILLLLLLNRGG